MSALEALVLAAFGAWLPAADPSVAARTARGIATVCEDASEAPVFGSHEKDALVLASIASFEGALVAWVDDGRCNLSAWRAAHPGELAIGNCDGGKAYGQWQIHTDGGIALVGTGWVAWQWAPPGSTRITGRDLVADAEVGARVALHILRQSGLVGYTGESRDKHPKADHRLARAAAYLLEHP